MSLSFSDTTSQPVFSSGDFVTFQLWDATANAPLSNTFANTFESAAFNTTPTVGAGNGLTSSAYSVSLAKGALSSVNDQFTLAFNQNAPLDTNATVFTISGLYVNLGANILLGHVVAIKATASNGTPFAAAMLHDDRECRLYSEYHRDEQQNGDWCAVVHRCAAGQRGSH